MTQFHLFLRRFSLALPLWFGSCASGPGLFVHRLPTGVTAERMAGEPVQIDKMAGEKLRFSKSGYVLIKSENDWNQHFYGMALPPKPPQLDWARKMILLAVSDWRGVTSVKVDSVIETSTDLDVYVTEGLPGEGCPVRAKTSQASDAVTIDRSDKIVHFYIQRIELATCGVQPSVTVLCSQAGGRAVFVPNLTVEPGSSVECDAKVESGGDFAIFDKTWGLDEIPSGSTAKIQFVQGASRVYLPVDIVGRYVLKYDVTNEGGQKASAEAIVTALFKDSVGAYVQLGWSDTQPSIDLGTLPPVRLEAFPSGKEAELCHRDVKKKPAWCQVESKKNSPLEWIHLYEEHPYYSLRVLYKEERHSGDPAVCIRTYVHGSKSAEVCDKEERAPSSVWSLGNFSAKTGTFESGEPKAAPTSETEPNKSQRGEPFSAERPLKPKPKLTPNPPSQKKQKPDSGSVFKP